MGVKLKVKVGTKQGAKFDHPFVAKKRENRKKTKGSGGGSKIEPRFFYVPPSLDHNNWPVSVIVCNQWLFGLIAALRPNGVC